MKIYLYQVALLGNYKSFAHQVEQTLRRRFDDLGLGSSFLRIITESDFDNRNPKAPLVALFFGYSNADDTAHPILKELIADSTVIFPCVHDINQFSNSIPATLQPINGFQLLIGSMNTFP